MVPSCAGTLDQPTFSSRMLHLGPAWFIELAKQAESVAVFAEPRAENDPQVSTSTATAALREGWEDAPSEAERIELPTGVASALVKILQDPSTYTPHTSRCWFHTDFVVEIRCGVQRAYARLCFGCGEIMLFGDHPTSHYELEFGAQEALERHLGWSSSR